MIYLDNAATTFPSPDVIETVTRAMHEHAGNPSSLHGLGAAAARALTSAREQVAALIRAEPAEIIFTGSGTEANALGFIGAARASRNRHLVISAIEHAAIHDSAQRLADEGFRITEVPPAPGGCVTPETVLAAIEPDTAVVAVMLVNNEIGTLQPIADIARALRTLGRKIHFHVDAVQSAGLVPIDVRTKGADSLALSAHKLHGPKGIGALWLRTGKRVLPLYGGGGQERDLRSGTENLAACLGFARAARAAAEDPSAAQRVTELRDHFEALVFAAAVARPTVPLTSPRAPHIASILVPGLPAEPLLHALEAQGVLASEGAACSSRARSQSRVLRALAIPPSTGALRFSLSRQTTPADIAHAATALAQSIPQIQRATH